MSSIVRYGYFERKRRVHVAQVSIILYEHYVVNDANLESWHVEKFYVQDIFFLGSKICIKHIYGLMTFKKSGRYTWYIYAKNGVGLIEGD